MIMLLNHLLFSSASQTFPNSFRLLVANALFVAVVARPNPATRHQLERRVLRLNSGDMVVTLAWKDPGQNHAATAPTANSFSICFGDTHGPNFCFEPRVISFKDSKGRMIPLVQEVREI
ncbi:hypothetical protein F5051DRAFT_397989 [Lentinula edodes]|nr:hypothetical protein F5051DRAFT_397989 [Lentinula edodes]